MIVNPGIRRFLGSAIQRLFNSASVSLPLTHTAVPQRAASGTTGTFTRATTSTWPNNDGYLVTGLAGEIGFPGARRVYNRLTFTEDIENAAWLLSYGGTGAIPTKTKNYAAAPDGTTTAQRIQFSVGAGTTSGDVSAIYQLPTATTALTHVWIKSTTGADQKITLRARASSTVDDNDLTATSTWTQVSKLQTGGTAIFALVQRGDWKTANTADILIWHPQCEDVTAQTTQTAGEYVSVGVESAPYYHGSMVDGVKCFPTDLSGNPIPSTTMLGYQAEGARTNLCLQSNAFTTTWTNVLTSSTQNVVGPDGGTTAWTLVDSSAVSGLPLSQATTLTAAAWTASTFVRKTTGAQASYPIIEWVPATGTAEMAAVTIDTTNGVATLWSAYTGYTMASGMSARCQSYNDDYWRVELTKTGTAAAHTVYIFVAGTANATQSTGTESPSVQGSAVFYGAQVELGSSATPYIPTTTVAVARNADVDQYPTTAGPIAAAGSIALDFTPYHAPSGTIALWGTYVDASNYTAILHDATNLIFRKRIAGSNYDATIANAFVSGTTYKVAATWGAAGTAIYLDGVAGTPHANTTAAQIAATMQVGADGNSLQQPGAGTTNLRIWQRQLSSPEGVAVTA